MNIMRRCFRWLKRLVLLVMIGMILVALGLILWFSTAPRTLPFGHEAMEYLLSRHMGAEEFTFDPPTFYVHIAKDRLEGEMRGIHARIGETHISAERILIALPLSTLLTAHIAYDGVFADALTIMPPHEDLPITLPHVRINPDAQHAQENQLNISIVQGEAKASVQGSVTVHDRAFVVDAQMQDVPARLIAVLHPDLAGLDMKIHGSIQATIKKNLRIKALQAQLRSPEITFKHPHYYPKRPLRIKELEFEAHWDTVRQSLQITQCSMQPTSGATLTLQGEVAGAREDATIHAVLTQFPADDVRYLWAKNVALTPRTWVTKRIKDGMITKGTATLTLASGQPTLQAELALRDMTVRYADHLPEARNARGTARFTQDSMHIDVKRAESLTGAVLNDAGVAIPSFSDTVRGVPMQITLPITAPAQDIATYMSAKHLNVAHTLALRPEVISGTLEGNVQLAFPLEPAYLAPESHSFDYLDVNITATLKHMSQMKILNQWDINDLNGTVALDNQTITLQGDLGLQGIPSQLDVTYDYSGEHKDRAHYTIKAMVQAHQLPILHVPIPAGIVDGNTQLEATIDSDKNRETTKARLDFTQASLNIEQIEWNKPKDQAAVLEVTQQSYPDRKELEQLHFSTKGAEVNGRVTLAQDGSVRLAMLDRIVSPRMDIALEYYGDNPDLHRVRIQGTRMYFYVGKDKKGTKKTSSDTKKPWNLRNPEHYVLGRDIDISLKELATNLGSLQEVRANMRCTATQCESMNLQAHYGTAGNAHAYLIRDDQQVRTVQGHISDVGELARIFNLSSQIAGGGASFNGAYTQGTLQGALIIKDLATQELPALTNLLTLASLRGIGDTLGGDGIAFDTISAKFTYDGQRITLEDGAAKGDALGVMLEGWIAPYGDARLNLDGTLIPSYMLNSLPAQVPLLGELLMGGEGEGVFATRFSVRGAAHDPSVLVNPLSMLTPGFLRHIFSVFPDIQPTEQKKEEPHAPTP